MNCYNTCLNTLTEYKVVFCKSVVIVCVQTVVKTAKRHATFKLKGHAINY